MQFIVEGKPQEVWADINDEGIYQVSNFGRIRNKKTGCLLQPYVTGKGYKTNKGYMTIRIKGKQRKVHRLVAEAFIPNCNNFPQVNHIDGNTRNNSVDNLEWCTAKENVAHSLKMGLHAVGENVKNAKLTTEQVAKIRETYICGDKTYGAKPLARKYGVSPATIKNIVNMKKWRSEEVCGL